MVLALEENRDVREQVRLLSVALEWERTANRVLVHSAADYRHLVDGLIEEVGMLRDDLAQLTHRVAGQRTPLRAEGTPQWLIPHVGCLVPIEEPAPREVIDLTDNSDEVVPDSDVDRVEDRESVQEVVDLGAEEEEQAAEV